MPPGQVATLFATTRNRRTGLVIPATANFELLGRLYSGQRVRTDRSGTPTCHPVQSGARLKKGGIPGFNDMEKEIIRLICDEKTSEDISKQLYIAKRTVEGIRAKILEKAGVKTPIGLVVYAIKNSIYFLKN